MQHTIYKYGVTLIHLAVFIIICQFHSNLHAQKIHSHNDYEQDVPFWNAYSSGLHSFEVDVFLKNGVLYATHEESEIIGDRTIENLYLEPIQKILALKLGEQKAIQILIDIKSEAEPTLQRLVAMLEQYPDITLNKDITLVISGNRPPVE